MMGISLMILLLSGCSKAEDSVLPADESSTNKDVNLNYSYTDTTPTAGCGIDSLPFETLSEDEIAALNLMREEEFLAHDVYIALAQLYTKPIFLNISRSEQRHTDAVKALMVKYNLPDPGADHVAGVFANADLQTLYNSLVSQGSKSLLDGLIVGCTIEDLDILDLKNHLLEVDNQDLTLVFNNLMRGSRNHLRSFYANVLFSGGTYTPQFITQGDFDAIVNSEHETGPGC